jgi:aminomethyltransferase
MNEQELENYETIRNGGVGIYPMERGLIAVHGNEAVQFLDGLITNDMKTLEDGSEMLAAFPNAQGRLIAVVRIRREANRYLFETEAATHKALHDNLFRFTFAGDFFVEDLSAEFAYFEVFGSDIVSLEADEMKTFASPFGQSVFLTREKADAFAEDLAASGAVRISDGLYEVLRIENGVPRYGVDMDGTTVVPELGIDALISYNKGCYIGQEIIARIHFRGHVAKQLTGLMSEPQTSLSKDDANGFLAGAELTTAEGKPAGRITSAVNSPKLERRIALGFVRYDHLDEGTVLKCAEADVTVKKLPFV